MRIYPRVTRRGVPVSIYFGAYGAETNDPNVVPPRNMRIVGGVIYSTFSVLGAANGLHGLDVAICRGVGFGNPKFSRCIPGYIGDPWRYVIFSPSDSVVFRGRQLHSLARASGEDFVVRTRYFPEIFGP